MMGDDAFTTAEFSDPTLYSTLETFYDDYKDDQCNNDNVVQFGAIVTPVFFTVVIVFSCVGNVLVLWVLVKYENLKSLTNAFLFNLAVSDLVFTVGLPFWAYNHASGDWTFGDVGCKAVSFIFFVGFYSSTIFLTTMTVHRYVAVVHPLSAVLNRKPYHCIVISVFIWMLSFGVATPHVIFTAEVPFRVLNVTQRYCSYNDIKWKLVGIYQQNAFFLISFIIITLCYVKILDRLLRPTSHTRRKTVRLILCIVLVFFLGWAPYNMSIFLESLISWEVSWEPYDICNVSVTISYVFYVSRLVAFSHCCLNPVFYVFMGIKFRSHLKKMLWNICRRMEQPQNRHSHFIYSNGEEISMY